MVNINLIISPVPIDLGLSDIMIYRGNLVEHWCENFSWHRRKHVFLHYNDSKTENSALNAADTRPHLDYFSF